MGYGTSHEMLQMGIEFAVCQKRQRIRSDKWLDVAPEEMAGPLCNIHSGDFVHDQPEESAMDQPVWQCLRYAVC